MGVPEYLLCVDFEATCDNDPSFSRRDMEIIEFPVVCVHTPTASITHKTRTLLKPEYSAVTEFCQNLTGITQAEVDNEGRSLQSALLSLDEFIKSLHGTFCILTHGKWDLVMQLRAEAGRKSVPLPSYCQKFCDIADEVQAWGQRMRKPVTSRTLSDLCKAVGADIHGRQHSGIDDAETIASIAIKLLVNTNSSEGTEGESTPLFTSPVDYGQQLSRFHETHSTVVRLVGLPYQATSHDLTVWCEAVGVVPQKMMVQHDERERPSGQGFVECQSHEDACRLLDNMEMIGERWVELWPSSPQEMEQTASTEFPDEGQGAKDVRPGDWTCPNCGSNVFASRLACFRCNTPKPLPGGAKRMAGDWTCPHCAVNNFAFREQCFKCHSPKPMSMGPVPMQVPFRGGTGTGGTWVCPQCRGNNYAVRETCYRCGAQRPQFRMPFAPGFPPQATPYPNMRPGDWVCPHCSVLCYASRDACYKCNATKPANAPVAPNMFAQQMFGYMGVGMPQAGMTGGMAAGAIPGAIPGAMASVRPGDWPCSTCNVNNFASRQQCFKCGVAKPAA